MLSRTRYWVPAGLWAAVIFALSARPTVPLPGGWGADKIAHFGAYAVLGWLLAYAADRTGVAFAWVIVIGLLYAASDEWHQSFVPGRSVELTDWVADALGVGTGTWSYGRWVRKAA